jgi:hypothetical protein
VSAEAVGGQGQVVATHRRDTTRDTATAGKGRPSLTFKEIGAAVLSLVLVIACVPVIFVAAGQIGSQPTAVKVGDATVVVDGYARAKELLGILFPLLSATVTFWLGVAVEGRRADANGEAAAQAGEQRDEAKEREQVASQREQHARSTAVEVLRELEEALVVAGAGQPPPTGGGVERRGGGGPVGPAGPDLDRLRGVVSDAKSRLLN